jgi:FemAB-related protein (PEP-CTERM system-associated)
MTFTVLAATQADAGDWQRFVASHPEAHFAHDWAWRQILDEAFGQSAHYLLARGADGAVAGILPMIHVRSLLFGSALVSMPYLNGGGILAATPDAGTALRERALALVRELGVSYLELRHRASQPCLEPALTTRSHKVAMALPLDGGPEALLQRFKKKFRYQVRRAWENRAQAQAITGDAVGQELLDEYYTVFARHMRDLGTPVYPKRLFAATLAAFGRRARMVVVRQGSEAVAVGITIGQGERIEIPWASALRNVEASSHNNILVYWQSIVAGCEDGYRVFDFGRSTPGSGPHQFKRHWGGETIPLFWYYAKGRGEIPDVNPDNPKFALLVQSWRRMPLSLANAMGPILTRSLP